MKRKPLPPLPTDMRRMQDRRKQGIEVQIYGMADSVLVWCGPHYVDSFTQYHILRVHRHWTRWRTWYDNHPTNRKRDYPAKHNSKVTRLMAHLPNDRKMFQFVV